VDDRFAVLIIPSYVNPQDSQDSPFASNSHLAINADPELREHFRGEGERRSSWKWFHTVNRVCSGVKKVALDIHFSLVLDIPFELTIE